MRRLDRYRIISGQLSLKERSFDDQRDKGKSLIGVEFDVMVGENFRDALAQGKKQIRIIENIFD